MAKKISEFETSVDSVLAEGDAALKLELRPPAVAQTNAELRELWAKVGAPLRDRLMVIGRTDQFRNALKIYRAGGNRFLLQGYNADRVRAVMEAASNAVILHSRALVQLDEVEAQVAIGLDPSLERPHLFGCKGSDLIRAKLKGVSHADREIAEDLSRLVELFGILVISVRRPVNMVEIRGPHQHSPSQESRDVD
jgi:hypothetical protein